MKQPDRSSEADFLRARQAARAARSLTIKASGRKNGEGRQIQGHKQGSGADPHPRSTRFAPGAAPGGAEKAPAQARAMHRLGSSAAPHPGQDRRISKGPVKGASHQGSGVRQANSRSYG